MVYQYSRFISIFTYSEQSNHIFAYIELLLIILDHDILTMRRASLSLFDSIIIFLHVTPLHSSPLAAAYYYYYFIIILIVIQFHDLYYIYVPFLLLFTSPPRSLEPWDRRTRIIKSFLLLPAFL